MMAPGNPALIRRSLVGPALAVALVFCWTPAFLVPFGSRTPTQADSQLRLAGAVDQAKRSDAELTVMYVTDPMERTRRKGGGRHPIYIRRKPAQGYAIADSGESTTSVLRRMRDMIDLDYVLMQQKKREHHREYHMVERFKRDYRYRTIQKNVKRSKKRRFQEAWMEWVRIKGKELGLTDSVTYNGPKPGREFNSSAPEMLMTLAQDKTVFKNEVFRKKERINDKDIHKLFRKKAQVPEEVQPGKWIDEGPGNIFNLVKRPLSRWAVDVRYRSGKFHPGIVM